MTKIGLDGAAGHMGTTLIRSISESGICELAGGCERPDSAPPSAVEELQSKADAIHCLETPEFFMAIGIFYQNFDQLSDEEVVKLLADAQAFQNDTQAPAQTERR